MLSKHNAKVKNTMDLSGKTVFITGASRGIGEAAAKAFAERNANVSLFARDEAALKLIANTIGQNALPLKGDVTNYREVKSAIELTNNTFGSLDILINNAATIHPIAHQGNADPEEWTRLIDINIKGAFYANHSALPIMIKKGGGTILTISSGAAHSAIEGWSAYCTSKAGTAMLTKCTDDEYRSKGIRAMGLSPGTVATQMQKDIKASGINPVSKLKWSDHIPTAWPARALVWMCTKDTDPLLGQEIYMKDPGILYALGLQ